MHKMMTVRLNWMILMYLKVARREVTWVTVAMEVVVVVNFSDWGTCWHMLHGDMGLKL